MAQALVRKTEYREELNQDYFLVRLLRLEIENRLGVWSKSASSKKLLDLGCGGQPFRQAIERAGFAYRGADREAGDGVALDFTFAIDGKILPQVEPFPFILCTEVMEHVLDWDKAFTNLTQLLAPGGEVLLTSPFVFPRHEEPHDYFRGAPAAYKKLAEKHGLTVVENRQVGNMDSVLGTVLGYALHTFQYLPASSSPSFSARVSQRVQRAILQWVWRLCLKGAFSAGLGHSGSFYLANIVVLRKPL